MFEDEPDRRADELLPLNEIPRHLPSRRGRKHHVSSVYRWATRGIRGVRLRTVSVGRTRCTTLQWLHEFFESLAQLPPRTHSENAPERPSEPRSPSDGADDLPEPGEPHRPLPGPEGT